MAKEICPEGWLKPHKGVEYDGDGAGDYYDGKLAEAAALDEELDGASLSRRWSRKRRSRRWEDPEKVVWDLMEIREAVRSLIMVHGVPSGTTVDIAKLGSIGRGAAGRRSEGTKVKPFIFLDRAVYDDVDPEEVLDVYSGIGLHEASHLMHSHEMLTRMESGELKSSSMRGMFENLLEDERIEMLAREESPGFGPYMQAAKKALFEAREIGNHLSKWGAAPDLDKVRGVFFAFIRTPYLLEKEHKEWTTIDGRCVHEELRRLLPSIPRTEELVKMFGGELEKLWDSIAKLYEDAEEMSADELAEKLIGPSDSKKESADDSTGSPGSGESGDGDSGSGGSSDGMGMSEDVAEDKTEATKEADTGAGEGVPAEDGEKVDVAGAIDCMELTDEAKEMLKDVRSRLDLQKVADDIDEEEELMKEKLAAAIKKAMDCIAGAEDAVRRGKEKEDAKKEAEAERLKEEVEKMDKTRAKRGRFGESELRKSIDRMDVIESGMSTEEEVAAKKAEDERLTVLKADDIHDDDMTRRTVLTHPVPSSQNKKHYRQALKEQKKLVNRMRGVFRFRLGKKLHVANELSEGRLHRKQLARAPMVERIFCRRYMKQSQGLSLCLLLDESGSMGSATPGGGVRGRAWVAFQVAVLITEALKNVPGIELEVYSFSSCGERNKDNYVKYLYGKKNPTVYGVGGYMHGAENYDHMAILTATKLFMENTTNKKRMMIVMSDGYPSGTGYGGPSAIAKTKAAVKSAEKKGIFMMQVAIAAIDPSRMFKNYVMFTDMSQLVNKMKGLVTRIVRSVS